MKERPIIFSPAMAAKVAAGEKSQTRRVVKPQPPEWCKEFGYTCFTPEGHISGRGRYEDQGPAEKFFKCPYGIHGRLWVRESWIEGFPTGEPGRWSCIRPTNFEGHGKAFYRADGEDPADGPQRKWRNAMFMPRWASRSTLEITGVRVERVAAISKEDALAEGITESLSEDTLSGGPPSGLPEHFKPYLYEFGFKRLWDSINGKREGCSWADNPWVFAISFRRLEAA